jgi:hypothetical protein
MPCKSGAPTAEVEASRGAKEPSFSRQQDLKGFLCVRPPCATSQNEGPYDRKSEQQKECDSETRANQLLRPKMTCFGPELWANVANGERGGGFDVFGPDARAL